MRPDGGGRTHQRPDGDGGGRTHPTGRPDGDGGGRTHPRPDGDSGGRMHQTGTAEVDLDYPLDLNRTGNYHLETMMLTDAPLLYTPGQVNQLQLPGMKEMRHANRKLKHCLDPSSHDEHKCSLLMGWLVLRPGDRGQELDSIVEGIDGNTSFFPA